MKPRSEVPRRLFLFVALLLSAPFAGAQAPVLGGEVFLNQPGAISATLLAAPSSPDYTWGAGLFYRAGSGSTPGTEAHAAFLFNLESAVGSMITPPGIIPSQGGLPLVFATVAIRLSDIPPGPGQPGNVPNTISITGFVPGSNIPGGALSTYVPAAVKFGRNNTAEIGFAPIGAPPATFLGYPIRIRVTNVTGGSSC